MDSPKEERTGLTSPDSCSSLLSVPSPIITRRTRTDSTAARALQNPLERGIIKSFSRSKGHGFVESSDGKLIFVHVSDIDGEYIPLPGDEVTFRVCPIPPKYEKVQAVHVEIINFTPEVHKKWSSPSDD